VLSLVGQFLEYIDERLRIISVEDETTALNQIRTDPRIECVLSDYRMPEMDGLTFLAHVRAHCPRLPFILYTTHGDDAVVAEAIRTG
ncbi:response regulator, partial [Chryseobacterium gambrini]